MGYQLTWLSCIFCEYYNVSVLGLIVCILFLFFFFYFNDNKIQAIKICITFALIGYLFDTILGYSEIFIIQSKIMFGYLPIWLLICCIPNEKFTDKNEQAIPCRNLTVDLLQAPVDISCGGFPVTPLTTTRIQANQPAGESCP